MSYNNIKGWFSWESFYSRMVDQAMDGAVFLELGCYHGKSTVYLLQKIKESGKNIKLFAVDTWNFEADYKVDNSDYLIFMGNIYPFGKSCEALRMTGEAAAAQFYAGEFDLVFIDANHSYEAVSADIKMWMPKVKPGGYIGGHDFTFNWPGVIKAVCDHVRVFNVENEIWYRRVL